MPLLLVDGAFSRRDFHPSQKRGLHHCLDQKSVLIFRLTGIPALYRLHLALFYLFGTYYSISKRLVGLQYVSFRAQANSQVIFFEIGVILNNIRNKVELTIKNYIRN